MFQGFFSIDRCKLLDKIFDRDGLMSLVGLELADAADGCLVVTLLVDAETREWLAGVVLEDAVRVQLSRAH